MSARLTSTEPAPASGAVVGGGLPQPGLSSHRATATIAARRHGLAAGAGPGDIHEAAVPDGPPVGARGRALARNVEFDHAGQAEVLDLSTRAQRLQASPDMIPGDWHPTLPGDGLNVLAEAGSRGDGALQGHRPA